MKKVFLLMLLASQAYSSATILNERIWCTGKAQCDGNIITSEHNSQTSGDISKAQVILKDQVGYQGLEINLGATHTFYIYNASPADTVHILKAKLCDMNNNCFNYEKTIKVRYRSQFGETIYSSLALYRDRIGAEPITAESEIDYYPSDMQQRKATLLVTPFPYD